MKTLQNAPSIAVACLVSSLLGFSHQVHAAKEDAELRDRMLTADVIDPQILEQVQKLPLDRKMRLLMYEIQTANPKTRDAALKLVRQTEGWDDYIDFRLRVLLPKAELARSSSDANVDTHVDRDVLQTSAEVQAELRQIFWTLRKSGDSKAVRFLMIGIDDPKAGRTDDDVQTLPRAQAAVERIKLAMSKAGGELSIPNAPKSRDVKEWQTWWAENKSTYIPKGKGELTFSDSPMVRNSRGSGRGRGR